MSSCIVKVSKDYQSCFHKIFKDGFFPILVACYIVIQNVILLYKIIHHVHNYSYLPLLSHYFPLRRSHDHLKQGQLLQKLFIKQYMNCLVLVQKYHTIFCVCIFSSLEMAAANALTCQPESICITAKELVAISNLLAVPEI